jgi:hypothetical protein
MTLDIRVSAVPFGNVQLRLGQPTSAESSQPPRKKRVFVYGQPQETLSCRPDTTDQDAPRYVVPSSTI